MIFLISIITVLVLVCLPLIPIMIHMKKHNIGWNDTLIQPINYTQNEREKKLHVSYKVAKRVYATSSVYSMTALPMIVSLICFLAINTISGVGSGILGKEELPSFITITAPVTVMLLLFSIWVITVMWCVIAWSRFQIITGFLGNTARGSQEVQQLAQEAHARNTISKIVDLPTVHGIGLIAVIGAVAENYLIQNNQRYTKINSKAISLILIIVQILFVIAACMLFILGRRVIL